MNNDNNNARHRFAAEDESETREIRPQRLIRPEYNGENTEGDEEMRKSRGGQRVVNKRKSNAVRVAAIVIAAALVLLVGFIFFKMVFGGGSGGDVEVPKIIGMTITEAREKNPDFEIVCTDSAVDETADKIVEQSPEARMRVREDNKVIKVKVESGALDTIEIENYSGRYGDEVQEELENLGLKVTVKEQGSNTVEAGKVVRQSLREGRKVSRGTKITIYVSDGSPEDGNPDDLDDGDGDTPSNTKEPSHTASATSNPTSAPTSNNNASAQTKSTYLTVYGPSNKDSALVQVRVNGSEIYSKTLSKGEDDMVKIVSSSSTANVEILHDGVVVQQSPVNLN